MKSNNSGFLTIDFIFATMMVMGFSVVLFSFAFTLSMVEVAQYITFSAARSYWAGHFTVSDQTNMGSKKFVELINSPAIKPLFRPGGWFELQVDGAPVGDYSKLYESKGISSNPDGTAVFLGSRVRFVANIMNIRFPIIGSTGSSGAFGANIGSYLSREPSEDECRGFESQRFNNILKLPGATYSANGVNPDAYVSIVDNGC